MNAAIRMVATTAAALALGIATPARAQAEDPNAYGDGYQTGDYGRLRFADGGATILHADGGTDAGERAGVNAPIFPGDAVQTGGDQRVEVQLAGGTLLRLDRGTEVVFQSLPDPSAKFQDNTVIVLNAGVVQVTSILGAKEEFRLDSRDASVYLLGDGQFRIESDQRGGTRVSSLRGVAEVVGNDSSVLVRGGTRSAVLAGGAPDTPSAYSAFASDGFDRWCAARDESYRSRDYQAAGGTSDRNAVPAEVRPYYGELSANGTWATVPEYGTVWSPSGVGAGWRPYNDGYWSYGPSGYFWVSYEPWGWAPYHYGNWQWIGGRGWCWIPGRVFAGAWVSWSWGSLYVGWAPLDFWGRPGWTGGPYSYGYYDPGCWTFVNYNNIAVTNVHRYAVPVGRVGDDLRHATVVSRAPRVDPRRLGTSNDARARALRQVDGDRAAHMRPIETAGTPQRRLSDVQDQLMRRPSRTTPATRGGTANSIDPSQRGQGTRTGGTNLLREPPVARPRRVSEDPRDAARGAARLTLGGDGGLDSRDGVRDLYQRMSRPRETRGQNVTPSVAPTPNVTRVPAQPRPETQRSQVRVDSPRPHESPRAAPPQGARPQPHPSAQARPKHGDKH